MQFKTWALRAIRKFKKVNVSVIEALIFFSTEVYLKAKITRITKPP
ncbi:hypothetical protein ACT1UF_13825 [Clostridium septicum]|uniref:Uncharacterized protein n=1 Tax=Clostridium septicum TaxID=1504 RepID=A0ABY5AYH3_CLOSE|nr:hypothetical protein [Clostridium septicum]USS00545.1 hypothetical protein NH397_13815 [Clostridium septicum]